MSFIPVILFVLIGGIWLWLWIDSHALFYSFRSRYPDEARRKIQHAFEFWAHPSKFFYFTGSDSKTFLMNQDDTQMLSWRNRIIRLALFAVIVPVILMTGLAMFVLLFTEHQ